MAHISTTTRTHIHTTERGETAANHNQLGTTFTVVKWPLCVTVIHDLAHDIILAFNTI